MKDLQLNHEAWYICPSCGEWMDLRLSNLCPGCGKTVQIGKFWCNWGVTEKILKATTGCLVSVVVGVDFAKMLFFATYFFSVTNFLLTFLIY